MKKRYVWLKLQKDFFQDKALKKLRRIAGGDTYTVIYLKMLLLSVRNEGKIFFENIESTFAEELSLELDETIENVEVTLNFLIKYKLLAFDSQEDEKQNYVLDYALNNIGSESESAERVRRHREKTKKLHCNGQTLQSNDQTLQGNGQTLQVTFCNDIKRREDIEKEKSKNLKDSFKNESINININKQISDFFEEIWALYPCKKGKSRITQQNMKTLYKIGISEMKRAIERYRMDPELKENNGFKNYQNGSTFFKKTYIEFLDVNYKEKENENKNHSYKNESREIDAPCFD